MMFSLPDYTHVSTDPSSSVVVKDNPTEEVIFENVHDCLKLDYDLT